MNRDEKAAAVADLQSRFNRASVALVATSQGLSVAKMQQLRRALRQAGGEYKVAKNTLARRALEDTMYARLAEHPGVEGGGFGFVDALLRMTGMGSDDGGKGGDDPDVFHGRPGLNVWHVTLVAVGAGCVQCPIHEMNAR